MLNKFPKLEPLLADIETFEAFFKDLRAYFLEPKIKIVAISAIEKYV